MSAVPAPSVRHAVLPIARRASIVRHRIVALLLALAVAAALLGTPEFTPSSSAAVAPIAAARVWAHNMLVLLNAERRAHHRAGLHMRSKLILSAHRHNATMAKQDSMSHQLPGEAFFADRISAAGYRWRAAGENIGFNSDISNGGLKLLERQMYGEKAPGDTGHRDNILSKSYTQVGIDVYFDVPNHKMWFTQDFGQPA